VGAAASASLDNDGEQWVLSPISSQNQVVSLKWLLLFHEGLPSEGRGGDSQWIAFTKRCCQKVQCDSSGRCRSSNKCCQAML